MSELAISSTNWLAISLRNGAAVVFNLDNTEQWQCLEPAVPDAKPKTDEDGSDLNRNLIKFTPDGRRLAVNGQNKQIYVYTMSDDKEAPWQLQRTVAVIKRASALDLTDDLLLIADKSGDVYRTDLSGTENVVLTADDCIMGHLSMLLDIAFVRTRENQPFILTADRDEKIRLSHYPNAYNIEGYCLGHDEFVSHVKLIDSNRVLSASGDGTLRLWHLPDCAQLDLFDAKTLTSSAKQISFGEPITSDENDASPIAHSIWKMDALSGADAFIALSTYTHRNHSIYLTTLASLQKPNNDVRRLTFDSKYGAIVDYCFASNDSTDLHVLFDSDTLLKVNPSAVLSSDDVEESLSTVVLKKDFHSMSNVSSLEVIFKQLFKTRGEPGDCSYYKRKNQRLEEQEEKRRKKQQLTSNENV